jgi:hypothetical protein
MKKIMTAMLGLSLLIGATSVVFGQSTTTKTTKTKKAKKTTATSKM